MHTRGSAPEHWTVRVTDTSVAQLVIPGSLSRHRVFDVDVLVQVRVPTSTKAAEFGLSLEINGSQQWSRTHRSTTPGQPDGLEYHCTLAVEPGRDTRLRARVLGRQCPVISLSLSAVEQGTV